MEPTFMEAKGLAKVFKLITLATLIAVVLNLVTAVPRVFQMAGAGTMQFSFFNFILSIGLELGRLAGSFWIFSQFAKGEYISEAVAKGCRLLSFIEFFKVLLHFQALFMIHRQAAPQWGFYVQMFQNITGTLVTASLLYCLGTAIHWAWLKQNEEDEKRLVERLNALPPLEEPPK